MALDIGDVSILSQAQLNTQEGFSFVTWQDLPAGAEIKFTNQRWDGSTFDGFRPVVTWTATSQVGAGTVVSITSLNGTSPVVASTGNAVSSTGVLNLNFGGDHVFAYESTLIEANLIFGQLTRAIAEWSAPLLLPPALDVPFGNMAALFSEVGAQYVGPRTGLDLDGYRTAISDLGNWGAMGNNAPHNLQPFEVSAPVPGITLPGVLVLVLLPLLLLPLLARRLRA